MFHKGSDHLYFVTLAAQRSLMTIARTVVEECRTISHIEVGLSGKGGSGGGMRTLIFSTMSVSP